MAVLGFIIYATAVVLGAAESPTAPKPVHFQLTLVDTNKATFYTADRFALTESFMAALESPESNLGDIGKSLKGRDCEVYSSVQSANNNLNVVLALDGHSFFADNVIEGVAKTPAFAERLISELSKRSALPNADLAGLAITIVAEPTTAPTAAPTAPPTPASTREITVISPYFELESGACEQPITKMSECQQAAHKSVTMRFGLMPPDDPPPTHCYLSSDGNGNQELVLNKMDAQGYANAGECSKQNICICRNISNTDDRFYELESGNCPTPVTTEKDCTAAGHSTPRGSVLLSLTAKLRLGVEPPDAGPPTNCFISADGNGKQQLYMNLPNGKGANTGECSPEHICVCKPLVPPNITAVPTISPTSTPTVAPTAWPTGTPTSTPSKGVPGISTAPTNAPTSAPTTIEEGHSARAIARAQAAHIHFQLKLTDMSDGTFTQARKTGVCYAIVDALQDVKLDAASTLVAADCSIVTTTAADNDESLIVMLALDAHSVYGAQVVEAEVKTDIFSSQLATDLAHYLINVKAEDLAISLEALPTVAPTASPTSEPTITPTFGFNDDERNDARDRKGHVHFHLTIMDASNSSFTHGDELGAAIVSALDKTHLGMGDLKGTILPTDCVIASAVNSGSNLIIDFSLDAHTMSAANVIESVIKQQEFANLLASEFEQLGIAASADTLQIGIDEQLEPSPTSNATAATLHNVTHKQHPTLQPTQLPTAEGAVSAAESNGKDTGGGGHGSTSLVPIVVLVLVIGGAVVAAAVFTKNQLDARAQAAGEETTSLMPGVDAPSSNSGTV
jgi:hypothetical protein